ncbi:14373_t:CDS:1 [Acaulospora morrowiae]|uniref:14373_t:CDS:1 n=1 Tax=Acaulospora morrowiae TaxID=94023 RepID=A0A9N9EI03_9GLOM|nr:14373_t:CDS:1 [Acaulospora morrowiae]
MAENRNPYKLQFPPSITVSELIKIHLEKGLRNVNKTLNAFLIYRIVYIREVPKNYLDNISILASNSWKDEPKHVKIFYKKLAKDVKTKFRELYPIHFKDQNLPIIPQNPFPTNANESDDANNAITKSPHPYDTFAESLQKSMEMTDDTFVNSLPHDLALTYVALMNSIPSDLFS